MFLDPVEMDDGCGRTKVTARLASPIQKLRPLLMQDFLFTLFPQSQHVKFHCCCSFLSHRWNQRLQCCDKRNGALTAQIAATLETHSERHGAAEGEGGGERGVKGGAAIGERLCEQRKIRRTE